jgi:hypothetical protein
MLFVGALQQQEELLVRIVAKLKIVLQQQKGFNQIGRHVFSPQGCVSWMRRIMVFSLLDVLLTPNYHIVYTSQAKKIAHQMNIGYISIYDYPPFATKREGFVLIRSRPMDNASAKRLSIIISDDLDRLIDELASEAGTSRTDIVRRALAVMKAFKQQKEKGRDHIGFVEDASKLDVEIVNVL